jgi:hypothetical protein
MAVQSLRKDESRNPRTLEEARALVKHVESLFMPWNVDAPANASPRTASCASATCPN